MQSPPDTLDWKSSTADYYSKARHIWRDALFHKATESQEAFPSFVNSDDVSQFSSAMLQQVYHSTDQREIAASACQVLLGPAGVLDAGKVECQVAFPAGEAPNIRRSQRIEQIHLTRGWVHKLSLMYSQAWNFLWFVEAFLAPLGEQHQAFFPGYIDSIRKISADLLSRIHELLFCSRYPLATVQSGVVVLDRTCSSLAEYDRNSQKEISLIAANLSRLEFLCHWLVFGESIPSLLPPQSQEWFQEVKATQTPQLYLDAYLLPHNLLKRVLAVIQDSVLLADWSSWSLPSRQEGELEAWLRKGLQSREKASMAYVCFYTECWRYALGCLNSKESEVEARFYSPINMWLQFGDPALVRALSDFAAGRRFSLATVTLSAPRNLDMGDAPIEASSSSSFSPSSSASPPPTNTQEADAPPPSLLADVPTRKAWLEKQRISHLDPGAPRPVPGRSRKVADELLKDNRVVDSHAKAAAFALWRIVMFVLLQEALTLPEEVILSSPLQCKQGTVNRLRCACLDYIMYALLKEVDSRGARFPEGKVTDPLPKELFARLEAKRLYQESKSRRTDKKSREFFVPSRQMLYHIVAAFYPSASVMRNHLGKTQHPSSRVAREGKEQTQQEIGKFLQQQLDAIKQEIGTERSYRQPWTKISGMLWGQ